jgi:predicted nucleotidyltransferase
VILFGSAARGEMHRDSDIDLIIISPDFKKMGFTERLILLSRLREGMKKSASMDIFGYTPEEFERLSKESIVLKEAKREGKIIR